MRLEIGWIVHRFRIDGKRLVRRQSVVCQPARNFLRLSAYGMRSFPTIAVGSTCEACVRGRHMRRRTRLIVSVLTGLLASALAVGYGASLTSEAERERNELLASYGGDLVSVCVATRDIDAGETLDEGNVSVEEWVASLLPADAATSLEEIIGKQATSTIPERAVLCPVYMETRSGTLDVPDNTVAVSVAVDAAHAVGGSVEPGTYVDVYVSADGITDPLCSAQIIDTSLVESASVQDDLSWATLAVSPNRVEEILAATVRGTIFLVTPGEGVDGGVEANADSVKSDGDASDDSIDDETRSKTERLAK